MRNAVRWQSTNSANLGKAMSELWSFTLSAFRPYDQAGRRMPWLLKIVRIMGVFWPAGAVVMLLCAPFNIGSYSLNGRAVSGPEFLSHGGGAAIVASAVFFGGVGLGIWRRRAWTRHALIAGLAGAFAISFVLQLARLGPEWPQSLASGGAVGLLAVWYLYLKAGTRTYYAALGHSTNETAA